MESNVAMQATASRRVIAMFGDGPYTYSAERYTYSYAIGRGRKEGVYGHEYEYGYEETAVPNKPVHLTDGA